jgi:hypothetical protein
VQEEQPGQAPTTEIRREGASATENLTMKIQLVYFKHWILYCELPLTHTFPGLMTVPGGNTGAKFLGNGHPSALPLNDCSTVEAEEIDQTDRPNVASINMSV